MMVQEAFLATFTQKMRVFRMASLAKADKLNSKSHFDTKHQIKISDKLYLSRFLLRTLAKV